MPEPAAISLLRKECRSLHRELERKDTFAKLLKRDVGIDDYISALSVLYRFVSTFESGLLSLVEKTPLSEVYTPRLPLLRADLEELNGVPPVRDDLPHETKSVEEACGFVYVLEGASLGSVIIRRHLKACLGSDLPLRYFGVRCEVPGHWEKVMGQLDAMLADPSSAAKAAKAAAGAFRTLISMDSR